MIDTFELSTPFFEFGPKAYLYGEELLDIAMHADALVEKYGVDIIVTAQYTDIERLSKSCKNIKIFAQHMDPITPGRGIGKVLGEALVYAGADGVLLNHAECPMSLMDLSKTIRRADDLGLATLVCAGDMDECNAVACLKPNIVLAESPALIGVGKRSEEDAAEIAAINESVRRINPELRVLHGAGITDERDIYSIVSSGAEATGSTSGILKSDDPKDMFEKMICAALEAYKKRNQLEG